MFCNTWITGGWNKPEIFILITVLWFHNRNRTSKGDLYWNHLLPSFQAVFPGKSNVLLITSVKLMKKHSYKSQMWFKSFNSCSVLISLIILLYHILLPLAYSQDSEINTGHFGCVLTGIFCMLSRNHSFLWFSSVWLLISFTYKNVSWWQKILHDVDNSLEAGWVYL